MSDHHGYASITPAKEVDPSGEPAATHVSCTRTNARRWAVWVLLGVVVIAAWASRDAALTGVGQLLITEDPLEPVEVIVISRAGAAGNALEAGRLYGEGYEATIVMPVWEAEPLAPTIRNLGIAFLDEGDVAAKILERSGVPGTAVHVLSGVVDGTQTEIAALAAFAKERQPASLLFVTARSHTRRARWLLRRALPATTRLLVRAPRTDRFDADLWWRSRTVSREVFTEYFRWFNTLVLRDPWGRPGASSAPGSASD